MELLKDHYGYNFQASAIQKMTCDDPFPILTIRDGFQSLFATFKSDVIRNNITRAAEVDSSIRSAGIRQIKILVASVAPRRRDIEIYSND